LGGLGGKGRFLEGEDLSDDGEMTGYLPQGRGVVRGLRVLLSLRWLPLPPLRVRNFPMAFFMIFWGFLCEFLDKGNRMWYI
jgi:hypothetical protein